MNRPDPIEILVSHQTTILVRCGRSPEQARAEAEDIVAVILEDLGRIGLQDVYLGVALRRARVYRMKSQGLTVTVICERLGICLTQAKKDYRAELLRRRLAA